MNSTLPYGSSLASITTTIVLGDPMAAPIAETISMMNVSCSSGISSFTVDSEPLAFDMPLLKVMLTLVSKKSVVVVFVTCAMQNLCL